MYHIENTILLDDINPNGFEFALINLRKGAVVARESWRGADKFIFMQVPSTIDAAIIPKMQSLPNSVKKIFKTPDRVAISYTDQICMLDDRGLLVNYSPSVSDIMAEDWKLIKE